jgi:large subunit ribosomal protein L15
VKLHELHPAPNSRKARTRVGRGIAAGQGKTSGRGQKGQGSRSSSGLPKGFEGGQMRLSQRLPKLRGFTNRWKKDFAVVNLGKLNRFENGSVVDAETLKAAGLISPARDGVKLLAAGSLSRALTVRVTRASAAARVAVEAAGGTLEVLEAHAAEAEAPEPRGAKARAAAAKAARVKAPEAGAPEVETAKAPAAKAPKAPRAPRAKAKAAEEPETEAAPDVAGALPGPDTATDADPAPDDSE